MDANLKILEYGEDKIRLRIVGDGLGWHIGCLKVGIFGLISASESFFGSTKVYPNIVISSSKTLVPEKCILIRVFQLGYRVP